MADKSEAKNPIEEVAEIVNDTETKLAAAEAALEHAEEEAEAAEEAAELIAEGARRDALAQLLEQYKTEMNTWRETLANQVTELSTTLANLSSQVAELATRMPEIKMEVTPQTDQSSIPEPSPEPGVKVEVTEPGSAPKENILAEPPKRMRRFL